MDGVGVGFQKKLCHWHRPFYAPNTRPTARPGCEESRDLSYLVRGTDPTECAMIRDPKKRGVLQLLVESSLGKHGAATVSSAEYGAFHQYIAKNRSQLLPYIKVSS